jgi:hypothetical protein
MSCKRFVPIVVAVFTIFLFVGCRSPKEQCRVETQAQTVSTSVAPSPVAEPIAAPAPVVAPTPAATPEPASEPAPAITTESSSVPKAIRIDAGATNSYTDSEGNVWLPDQGFADGSTVDRGNDVQIADAKDPAIYRTEHYGMTLFSQKLPNGKYTVKLHFAETYDGVTSPGQRVFSFNVGGHEFKDFDVCAKVGGTRRAYVETVDVDVTDGKLDIAFTPTEDNPEINGIEIIPAP